MNNGESSEIVNILKEIKQNQEESIRISKELVEYIRSEEERKQKQIGESIELQKLGVKRQQSIIRIVIPLLLAVVVYAFFLLSGINSKYL